MFCAVLDCEQTATHAFELADGQPVAMVCDHHDLTLPGWVLRTGISHPPTLYPPGVDVPPF